MTLAFRRGVRLRLSLAALASFAMMQPAHAENASGARSTWITLGTAGGPMSAADRSQPANVLLVGGSAWLVDSGDGAVQQLAKAGIGVHAIEAVFLSHLHFDHTGGLAALLGLRLQIHVKGKLAIYGPPGTAEMVAGLVASMRPASAAGFGMPGQGFGDPAGSVEAIELADGQSVKLGASTVTARQNKHYSFAPSSDMDLHYKSLSFRFDAGDRSIVYTGDTGPSSAVEELARGADLLVSELIDEDATIAAVRRNSPDAPPSQLRGIAQHLTSHHLTPADVGKLALKAGVGRVVVTHLAGDHPTRRDIQRYVSTIRASYRGPVAVAKDLDRF